MVCFKFLTKSRFLDIFLLSANKTKIWEPREIAHSKIF